FRGAQRGPAAEDDQQLLRAVVEVVDGRVARPQLVDAGAQLWAALDEPRRLRASARPAVQLVPPVVEDVRRRAHRAAGPSSSSSYCSGAATSETSRRRSRRRSSRSTSGFFFLPSSLMPRLYKK